MSTMSTPAWEQTKENAAPLQRGRHISEIERASGLPPEEIERKIQHYETLVRPSEPPHVVEIEDDPLSNWLAYIKFYQNAFPSDTREQFLLMERCTRALVKMRQYADDDRFVGVCAKYADKTKDPNQVFKYLHQQKVGANTALFWIAWAYVAEKDGDFPFAEQIFKKGISKNAQPLQMLRLRHKQFQRRMSRHWLQASATHDQLEDDEEEVQSQSRQRGALRGLSHDRRHRARTGERARATSRRQQRTSQTQNGSSQNGSFAIFVEREGENAENGYNLDQCGVDQKRTLDREADRRKENTLAAERWNERGGLTNPRSKRQPQSRSKAPLSFPVFVDEECAAQHERESQEKRSKAECHRQVRDERTFRERTAEESAAKLARDPLRYVLNPSQLETDQAAEVQSGNPKEEVPPRGTRERRNKVGFDKRLLKNNLGEEQSFEEARAVAKRYKITSSSQNFNLLKPCKEDSGSQMDCDDGLSLDVSGAESDNPSSQTNTSTLSCKPQKMSLGKESKVLFHPEPSFEGSLNQTAISTASSTVHATDAVGLPTKREEETINTKYAMKELSMMFSSPALGIDDVAKKAERQAARIDHSILGGADIASASFEAIGDALGGADLDNSIVNAPSGNDENWGPRNPLARAIGTEDLDQQALQEIESDHARTDASLDCTRQSRARSASTQQQDPLRGAEVLLSENPGFEIYEDSGTTEAAGYVETDYRNAGSSPLLSKPVQGPTFAIFDDHIDTGGCDSRDESEERTLHPIEDGPLEDDDTATLSVFEKAVRLPESENRVPRSREQSPRLNQTDDDNETASSMLFNTAFEESNREVATREKVVSKFSIFEDANGADADGGDTASSSLFNEVLAETGPKGSVGFSIFVDREEDRQNENRDEVLIVEDPNPNENGGGDTATSSSFNEALAAVEPKGTSDFSIYVDEEASRGENSRLGMQNEVEEAMPPVDYVVTHERDKRLALRRVNKSSSIASNSKTPLTSLLSQRDRSYYLPHLLLPPQFRSRLLKNRTTIALGKHSGVISKELGRGAYGIVVLMEGDDGSADCTIAVKAQSPTDCLAWEYDILLRVEHRVSGRCPHTYPFPRALSFVSLADGGMFGMTTGSKSGLNLVDLVNFYKTAKGEHVPELVALHYTSRMLWLMELLHWHGRVLHCDVKPDNFVLSEHPTPECHNIQFSDLVLVDFGRAVDLEGFSGSHRNVRKVRLTGDAARDDMRCIAMRNESPWSYDIDTFGILCSAHVLLFGSHMDLRQVSATEWKPAKRIKRYWQQDLWDELFRLVLSFEGDTGSAIGSHARSLRFIREKIDAYLDKKQPALKELLARQASLLPTCRAKIK